MQVSVGGLILAVVAVGAGAACCWMRSGNGRWERPAACSLIALSTVAVLYACVVLIGQQLWTRFFFAIACIVLTCAVYVTVAREENSYPVRTSSARSARHAHRPTRPMTFVPLPETGPRTACSEPASDFSRPVVAADPVTVVEPRPKPLPALQNEVVRKSLPVAVPAPMPKIVMEPVPALAPEAPPVSAAAPPLALAPEPVPAPEPPLAPEPAPAPDPEPDIESESMVVPAAPVLPSAPVAAPDSEAGPVPASLPAPAVPERPERPVCSVTTEACLSKARALKGKGKLSVAARLFKDAAQLADCSERRAIQFEELSCYVKAGLADRALALAEELRASSDLAASERIRLDAVSRML